MALFVAAAALTGCDAESEAEARLDSARTSFEKANQGYVEAEQGQDAAPSMSAFRVQTLGKASGDLQAVLDGGAGPAQKQRARRLLAQVHASQARQLARQAEEATAALGDLRRQMRQPLGKVASARPQVASQSAAPAQGEGQSSGQGQSQGQGQSGPAAEGGDKGGPAASGTEGQTQAQPANQGGGTGGGQADDSSGASPSATTPKLQPPASPGAELQQGLTALREGPPGRGEGQPLGLKAQQAQLQQLNSQIQKLSKQIDGAKQRSDRLQKQAQAKLTEAQKLRSNAFTAEGEKEFEMLQNAAKLAKEGNNLSYKADQVQLELTQLQRQMDRLTQKQKLTQGAIKQLKGRISEYQKAAQTLNQQQQTAQTLRQASQKIAQLTQKLNSQYQQQVQKPYNQAIDRIAQSIDLMQTTVDQAESGDRASYQVALLGYYVDRADILSQHATTVQSLASSLQAINRPALAGDAAQRVQQALSSLKQTHQQLAKALNQAIDAGTQLAGNVSANNKALTQAVQSQRQQLESYGQMVKGELAAR